jgi:hypothetical protein
VINSAQIRLCVSNFRKVVVNQNSLYCQFENDKERISNPSKLQNKLLRFTVFGKNRVIVGKTPKFKGICYQKL